MAGIYVHIPFCKQACTYCDFHFSTSMRNKQNVLDALKKEAKMRVDYLGTEPIETLYFGGGTPSLLNAHELTSILKSLRENYNFAHEIEFTYEANPDDLSAEKLNMLVENGVNRLSIGIQSFDDKYLEWMNRAHRSADSVACVKRAHEAGITNISIDLIYGLPNLEISQWKSEIDNALALGVTHISAYCLTVEPATALGFRVRKGTEKPVDDEAASQQFEVLIEKLAAAGFEQYEVSNFAREGFYSKHNTSYWFGIPYLGLGPSAHSFKPAERAWNVANNSRYIQKIEADELPITSENLSLEDQFNEWVMTGLRTKWGLDILGGTQRFKIDLRTGNENLIEKLVQEKKAELNNGIFRLTKRGFFLADGIASEFFLVEENSK
ncbi:radical SAM family heme chaperone HemW [Cryomorpha ignava]|uniref:Heme chaperone HemW n=1 Tax=Cryomorpha ignava TaxID=101383 RepID=A0A7K3WSA7_9FLAO|nr:radical SAM family heme chaperone HemW [Cryomorpha ignava]NEN24563.1 radical SAM family heme chaperone HemW [Cryomorpha ignava]